MQGCVQVISLIACRNIESSQELFQTVLKLALYAIALPIKTYR